MVRMKDQNDGNNGMNDFSTNTKVKICMSTFLQVETKELLSPPIRNHPLHLIT